MAEVGDFFSVLKMKDITACLSLEIPVEKRMLVQ